MQAVLGYAEHVDMPLCGNRGKGDRVAVDEDVGSYFIGKHFGVRLFEGVYFPVIGRGFRANAVRPYGLVRGLQ